MPFNFSGFQGQSYDAKLRVVDDGEMITVSATDGYTVTSTLSQYTAFAANPSRSATGVWSVTMKDIVNKLIDWEVSTVLKSGHYLATQNNLTTTDSNGKLVLHWTFNVAGTPTDLPTGDGAQQFLVHVRYSESSL